MSKKSLLDAVEVKSPCSQSWSEMRGNDRIRFCDHCAKDAHNLSRFTRKDARRLVKQSNGAICVRYVRRLDGRIERRKDEIEFIHPSAFILHPFKIISAANFPDSRTSGMPPPGCVAPPVKYRFSASRERFGGRRKAEKIPFDETP